MRYYTDAYSADRTGVPAYRAFDNYHSYFSAFSAPSLALSPGGET